MFVSNFRIPTDRVTIVDEEVDKAKIFRPTAKIDYNLEHSLNILISCDDKEVVSQVYGFLARGLYPLR